MAIETGREDDLSSSPLSLSQLETLRLGQGVGRSGKDWKPGVLGSLWGPLCSAWPLDICELGL